MKPMDVDDPGNDILSNTRPAIASGLGPFVAESSGDSVAGASAAPYTGSPGLFMIPTAIPEDLRRAVELHEYLHLSSERSYPELSVLAKLARNAGIDDMIVQSVMDSVVNTIGKSIPEVSDVIENLAFSTNDEEYLTKILPGCTEAQKAAYQIRPGTIRSLTNCIEKHCAAATSQKLAADVEIIKHKVSSSVPPSTSAYDLGKLTAKFVEEANGASAMKEGTRNKLVNGILRPKLASAAKALMGKDETSFYDDSIVKRIIDPVRKVLGPHTETYERLLKTRTIPGTDNHYPAEYLAAMSGIMQSFVALHEFQELEKNFDSDHERTMKEHMAELSPASHEEDESSMIRRVLRSHRETDSEEDAATRRRQALEQAMGEIPSGGYVTPGNGSWGNMSVRELPFVQNLTMAMAKRKVRFGFEGAFRYPHRIPPAGDGSCFGSRRKIRGGTLLIDGSGSMSLSVDDLKKIVEILPACTIALYGGTGHSGDLVILAKNGQLVDLGAARRMVGGGNIVDGPAIQWLIKQEKPQLLISDGAFTGIGDMMYANLIQEASALIASNKVIWLSHISSAEHFVKTHKNMFLK